MNKTLIVDDNFQNLYLLESILKGTGYSVITARNGSEALDLAKKEKPDIIISDILMPVMDGFEFCRKCREDESLKVIPFIFYTATYTEPRDEEFALSLGADRFIIKPQKPEILARIIHEVLEEYSREGRINHEKPLGEEAEILRQYNAVLFNKLEKKVIQLETEILNRRLAEKEVRKLNDKLEIMVRERTSKLEDALLELESFSYSVSHDLKTPLRHINSFAMTLKGKIEKSLDEKELHYLDVIIESSEKMSRLIDDLLFFSRMGRSDMIKQKIDLNRLLAGILADLDVDVKERNIIFKVSDLPVIIADSSMLRIVFMNLITNAVKFTSKKDEALIEIGFSEDEGYYNFFVKDNGAGFNMNYAEKLFGVFKRLHSEKDYEGTGIGLATVRQIIKRHGGNTWAKGETDRGAVFYFSIPMVEMDYERR